MRFIDSGTVLDLRTPSATYRPPLSEIPVEIPAVTLAEIPVEIPAVTLAEIPVEIPAVTLAEIPVEIPAEIPVVTLAEIPVEIPAVTPVVTLGTTRTTAVDPCNPGLTLQTLCSSLLFQPFTS
ncbi:hypothetical protein BG842_11375 [Haladaptatus sp. W1]|uniref:hypothetical protein n=1 Tax=Haladaptatus sp. W1 TaxID=1897478 RepID=UPI000849D92B|nr:hypothetical protein [Haladaptatus sp. W1]ODR80127.1 hypothetical protein BG842_11375 [Haladaptatus sp. W1]